MTSFHGKTLPPITDDVMFEKFTAMLWERRYPESTVVLMGRSGQAQSGLDVLVTTRTGKTIGIQCKAMKLLTEKTLLAEIGKALKFKPMIDQFVLATTSPHDVAMVAAAQRVSEEHSERDLFPVTVFGWGELLRLAEPHLDVIQHFYPEFAKIAEGAPNSVSLVIEPDLAIAMDDLELALFCSETAAKLASDGRTEIQIDFAARTNLRGEIAQLGAGETLTTEQRMHRSNLEANLAHISGRLRQLEQAIPVLLTDDEVRSPWLIGANWIATATVLRRLVLEILCPATSIGSHAMALKIRSPQTPAIVTWLDLSEEEQAAFRSRNPDYLPSYFLGGVFDLGPDLGLRAVSAE